MNYQTDPVKIGVTILIALGILYVSATCLPEKASNDRIISVGDKLSDVAGDSIFLVDSANNMYDLSNFTGRVHLLSFYDGGCELCGKNQKMITRIANEFKKDSFRTVFIGNANTYAHGEVKKASQTKEIWFFDPTGVLGQKLGVEEYPLNLVVDEKGVVRQVITDYDTDNDNGYIVESRETIRQLLGIVKN